MTVPFTNIPANLAVPLFYAEMDNSKANSATGARRAVLMGQKLVTGTAAAGVPVIVSTYAQAKALFGVGSMLARMVWAYRNVNPFAELWCIPLADNAAGVAQVGTITATGPATAAGTINLYIAGQLVQVGVASGDTATTVAASIATAVNAASDLPVTATAAAGVVTWTAKWKGATGADIQVCDSYLGTAGGQALPAGVALAYAGTVAGVTDPVITAGITALGDDVYDYIVTPYADASNLALLGVEMSDSAGRWSPWRQLYGHAYTARRGTLSSLLALQTSNDQHLTNLAVDANAQPPVWEVLAAYVAANATGLDADVARPTQTLPMTGLLAPAKKFLMTERQSLLSNGYATTFVSAGTWYVERAITTYQKNAFGQVDNSYLDSETMHTSAYVLRRMKAVVTSKFARSKLADDGMVIPPGDTSIVTPKTIRGELIGEYYKMMAEGIVENADLFAQYLIVERSATDPNRVNVLYPPDYVNQLRVFAVLDQFRLNY